MKFYGNVDLQENELQEIVFQTETTAPTSTVAGRLMFKNKRLFVAAEIVTGSPVWVPLTNEFDTYQHTQSVAASNWSINHNLNSDTLLVMVYDSATNAVIIPNEISYVDADNLTISFGSAQAGRAVLIEGLKDGDVDGLMAPVITPGAWDPSSMPSSNYYLLTSNNNLTVTTYGNQPHLFGIQSTGSASVGKYYTEHVIDRWPIRADWNLFIGLSTSSHPMTWNSYPTYGYGVSNNYSSRKYDLGYGSYIGTNPEGFVGNIMSMALDLDNGKLWFGVNGNWTGGGDPSTGAVPLLNVVPNTYFLHATLYAASGGTQVTSNFGASAFAYPVPTGFSAGWPA